MTDKPLTKADIEALACLDCPADVELLPSMISGITRQPVLTVAVHHAQTCPWASRCVVAPVAIVATEAGIVLHHRRGIDDDQRRGIDDDLDTPPSTEPTD